MPARFYPPVTEDRTAQRSIDIAATPAAVWQAITDPALTNRWRWEDGSTHQATTWQVGDPITFTGNWDGHEYEDHGIVLHFEPEQQLAYTYWGKFWQVPDAPENYTTVQFTLEPTSEGTRLQVTHSHFPTYEVFGHWRFYWVTALDRIKAIAELVPAA